MKEGQLKRISKTEKKKKNQVMQCYLMIALPLIGFFVFILYPIFWTFRLSAFSYNGVASMTKFVGLDNFKTLFTTDFTYWKMWGNTLIFTVCKIRFNGIYAKVRINGYEIFMEHFKFFAFNIKHTYMCIWICFGSWCYIASFNIASSSISTPYFARNRSQRVENAFLDFTCVFSNKFWK